MWLGAHIGIAEGLGEAPRQGRTIGCDAIQIFSKSPKMWAGPAIAPEAAVAFQAAVREVGLKATAVHHGYLDQPGNPKKPMLARSRKALLDEVERATMIGVDGLILHPGAHMGEGPAAGLGRIVESLNWVLDKTPHLSRCGCCWRTPPGRGPRSAATFPESGRCWTASPSPRDRVGRGARHLPPVRRGERLPDPGDLRGASSTGWTPSSASARSARSTSNDAKADLGSHLDRHENIGKGKIGARRVPRPPSTMPEVGADAGLPGDARSRTTTYAAYVTDLATLRGLVAHVEPAPPKRATSLPHTNARHVLAGPRPRRGKSA